jgi:RHS repeat-associated protein
LLQVGGAVPAFTYEHDASGNLNHMPHLAVMHWDASDRLKHAARNRDQLVWYAYAGDGQRVRKVFENHRTIEETIYIGTYEVYRRRPRGTRTVSYERSTRHVTEGDRVAARIETVTVDRASGSDDAIVHTRYQIRNHLGSSSIELNDAAQVVGYEEHHPFGSSAVHVTRASNAIPKRYRYAGKERDQETGLHYFGARYYASWLGRWISSDPVADTRVRSAYMYVSNDPVNRVDPDGRYEVSWKDVRQGAGDVVVGAAIGAAVVVAAIAAAPLIGAATVAVVGATGAAALASAGSALLTTAAVVGTAHLLQRQAEGVIGSDFATGKRLSDAERSYRLGEAVGTVGTFGLAKLGSSIKSATSSVIRRGTATSPAPGGQSTSELIIARPAGAARMNGEAEHLASIDESILAKGVGELSFGANGRKIDFLFNRNIDQSNARNALRAKGNASRIGIADTAANRAEVTRLFNEAYNNPATIISSGKLPGSNVREFFLPGVTGTGSKIHFVEQNGKVITIMAK